MISLLARAAARIREAIHPLSGTSPVDGAPPGPTCPICSAANSAGTRFCGQCGTSLVPAKCASCGTKLTVGVKFCSQCGNPRV